MVESEKSRKPAAWALTEHFDWAEFHAPGVSIPPCYRGNIRRLADRLEKLRDILKKPIRITSGYRSPEQNRLCGGAPKSFHMKGIAVDVDVPGVAPRAVAVAASRFFDGIHCYEAQGFCHLDIRGWKARW